MGGTGVAGVALDRPRNHHFEVEVHLVWFVVVSVMFCGTFGQLNWRVLWFLEFEGGKKNF